MKKQKFDLLNLFVWGCIAFGMFYMIYFYFCMFSKPNSAKEAASKTVEYIYFGNSIEKVSFIENEYQVCDLPNTTVSKQFAENNEVTDGAMSSWGLRGR